MRTRSCALLTSSKFDLRISNMGDETDETTAVLLKALDSALAELGVK